MGMIIKSDEPKARLVEDYDIYLVGGRVIPLTLDLSLGDHIEFETCPGVIFVQMSKKVSPQNPDQFIPAEDMTIYKSQVLFVQHRTREALDLTVEQQMEWEKAILGQAH